MSDDLGLDDDPQDPDTGGGAGSMVLPVVTALVAAGAGLAIGALAVGLWWQATPPEEVEVVKLRELTDAEIDGLCKPFVTDTLSELTEAQAKVVTLESEVATKEARVQELEEAMKRGAVAGKKLREELAAAKVELESLREQLAVAIEEKEQALEELERTVEKLRETEEELDETKQRLTLAEEDVLTKRWTAFVQSAQLEVCEKGRRRKMGRCREAVTAALGPEVQAKYRHCVKSGQAVPGLFEADRNMERLPDYSQYLNQDERIVRDWYVTLCDPSLPEADDFSEALRQLQAAEDAAGSAEGAAAGGEDKTLDDMLDEVLPEEGGEE